MYSSRGPLGRPLYPLLSRHCNRPFPRDSRVFTRRLTPNLVCGFSHTESTTKSHKNYTVEQSQDTMVTEQLYKVTRYIMVTRQHTIQEYTSTRQGHPQVQSTKVYTSMHPECSSACSLVCLSPSCHYARRCGHLHARLPVGVVVWKRRRGQCRCYCLDIVVGVISK